MSAKVVDHMMLYTLNLGILFGLFWKYFIVKYNITKYVRELIKTRMNNNSGKTTPTENAEDSLVSIKKTSNIFIDQALQIYHKQQFSFNDVAVESNNIVAAAFETSATAVFSVLAMMAMHPDIQERLFNEIMSVFPDKDFEMEYEHMQQLPYLDMIINETLRLAPPVSIIGRQVVEETQLTDKLMLPKGLQILIPIYLIHRNHDIWGPNAHKFDPNNFLPENISTKHAYAYLPFSKGMRNCIGWRYALLSMKVTLSGIIRHFRITTSMKYNDLQFHQHVTLTYANEPLFKLCRRE